MERVYELVGVKESKDLSLFGETKEWIVHTLVAGFPLCREPIKWVKNISTSEDDDFIYCKKCLNRELEIIHQKIRSIADEKFRKEHQWGIGE